MHEAEKLSLDQIEAFLKASEGIRIESEAASRLRLGGGRVCANSNIRNKAARRAACCAGTWRR